MATLQAIVKFLDEHLSSASQPDFCPNGIQVEGAAEISKIVLGVTACQELSEAAKERGAEMILVHHGIFWGSAPARIQGIMKRRIGYLLKHDISLVGYHLPLDRHPQDGNNAQIADRFGLIRRRGFAPFKGNPVGLVGELPQPMGREAFGEKVQEVFGSSILSFPYGPDTVKTVALMSGKGDHDLEGAIEAGADVYLTGEAGVSTREHARECEIGFYAVGHHASERWGVQTLGKTLKENFGVEVEYVDVENPV